MRTLIVATAVVMLAGMAAGNARGGMHGNGAGSLMAPANPTVPPSLTPDPRLTGSAPLPPHHQPTQADLASLRGVSLAPDADEAKVDRIVKSICRGC